MATQTRFKGLEGETLSQLTIKQNDMIQVRHEVGTADDSDKGLPFSVLQSIPIAVCISSASETNKTATIDNFADFEIQNGREVIVYMANANTATNPTLTINGVGLAAMESGIWQAGTFIKCKYVSITVSGTQITRWLVDAGAYNTTNQLNGALAEGYKETYETYRTVGKLKYSWEQDYNKAIREVDVFFSGVTLTPSYSLVTTNFRQFIQYGTIMNILAVCIGEDNNIICNGNCYINTQNENLLVSQSITSEGKFTVHSHCKYFI